MGRDKQPPPNSGMTGGSLDVAEKAIRAGRFPKVISGVKPAVDEDTGKVKEEFWQLDSRLFSESVSKCRVYEPLAASGGGASAAVSGKKRGGASASELAAVVSFKPLDSLSAVAHLAELGCKNPGVLVFASDTNAGGSRTASNVGTQEESINRNSTASVAYAVLAKSYPIPTMGVAYAPAVQTLDSANGPQVFGLIAGALRLAIHDLSSGPNEKEKAFLEMKAATVLACAAQNEHTSLVLGAWGAGAFGGKESAGPVAAAFRTALNRPEFAGAFTHVVFAIPSKELRLAFESVFGWG